MVFEIVFWMSFLLVVHVWVGYPLILRMLLVINKTRAKGVPAFCFGCYSRL